MEKRLSFFSLSSLLLLLILLSRATSPTAVTDNRSTYIIHVSPSLQPSTSPTPFHWYSSILRSLPRHLRYPIGRIIYTYDRVAFGFASRLTAPQAAKLRLLPHILAVIQDSPLFTHSTRTPSFLHLSPTCGLWPESSLASSIVIGVIDTGIFPNSRSFIDPKLPPPPSTFHTSCGFINSSTSSPCNNKIVGAKAFHQGYAASLNHPIDETRESISPLDIEGHGTHLASIAAGAVVPSASFFQLAEGEARGIATKARIAVYRVCSTEGYCLESDILAGMDAAVADGVNVIIQSLGSNGRYPKPYDIDNLAIGTFGAARHGVVVTCSAGNAGARNYRVDNIYPWAITVGASTIDREFPADVVLGNYGLYSGVSLYAGFDDINVAGLPLVYGGDAGSNECISKLLNSTIVTGKIVLCDRGKSGRINPGRAVKFAGGAGMILANTEKDGENVNADLHLIAAIHVGASVGNKIRAYISSTSSPTATIIFRGTAIGSGPSAPRLAAFSSRGPNHLTPEILKPDVIAPGVSILGAWTKMASPTNIDDEDQRRVDFNIIDGTSVACAHVAGIAGLLRGVYPDWSPAAIKSAIMTTAYNVDGAGEIIKDASTGKGSNPFGRGAGHVEPNKALDPGLVYDSGFDDYLAFFCSINYNAWQISLLTRDDSFVNCSSKRLSNPGDLNYPSFSVVFSDSSDVVTYKRTVKNVGGPRCRYSGCKVYHVEISSPPGVNVVVKPTKLVFDSFNQSLSYEITFTSITKDTDFAYGWISWSDKLHEVRSPIAVIWQQSQVVSM